MSILHTVNQSPFERNALASCLRFATAGSAVLLFENGVYAALLGTQWTDQIQNALNNLKFYVLSPDLSARGLNETRVISGIQIINYADFVDLTVNNDKVQAWL